ncbi:MAG: ATP-binding protein [bacterium]
MQEQLAIEEVLLRADNIAQTIQYATRIHMIEKRKEMIRQTIHYLVERSDGIEQIRLLDKKGNIRETTVPGERGRIINQSAPQCLRCHTHEKPFTASERRKEVRIQQSDVGSYRVALLTHAIYNESDCFTRCHEHHPETQKVLGIFEIVMSLKDVDQKIAGNRRRFIQISIIAFFFIIGNLGVLLFYYLIRPMDALLKGVQSLSLGDFNAEIPVFRYDEFGRLSQSFNNMVKKLNKEIAYRNLLLYDNSVPTVQEGVGEGGNRVITDNRQSQSGSSFEEIYQRIQDETHMKLVRSVKLASLGQLSAGIAHEINNPLTAVLSYSSLLLEKAASPKEKQWLSTIVEETKRCRNIVAGLLDYARQSTPEKVITQMNDIIERAICLVENKESFHNIRIIKKLGPDLPQVKVDRGQIYQVLTNLMINAADAMEGKGTLTVESRSHHIESKITDGRHFVEVSIRDTGCGIPEQNIEMIFDPFFTTKGPTVGTGLGLSICYGIIKRHNGSITVHSEIGEGSTFTIYLPVEKEEENE